MKRLEMTEADSAVVYRALNVAVSHNLSKLAQVRHHIKAALDLGMDPDKRDVANAEYHEFAIGALRRAKKQLDVEQEAEE